MGLTSDDEGLSVKIPGWAGKASGFCGVFFTLLGVAYKAGVYHQHEMAAIQSAVDTSMSTKLAVDALAQKSEVSRRISDYQSRQIYTLDANRGLINNYVKAPQIPMPQPDIVKQQKDDHSYFDHDQMLSKAVNSHLSASE